VQYAIYRSHEVSGASSPLFSVSTATSLLTGLNGNLDNNGGSGMNRGVNDSSHSIKSNSVFSSSNDTREVTALVEKLLRDVVVTDQSPVLQLFSKRLYRILLRVCLQKPFVHKLAPYSLQSKAQERNLARLIELTTKLFQHTIAVHGDMYTEILRTLARKYLPPSTTSSADNP